jgi:hypothetical protein
VGGHRFCHAEIPSDIATSLQRLEPCADGDSY